MSVCTDVSSCVSSHIWLGVSSTAARQYGGLGVLALNRSELPWGRDVLAGAHGTARAQSSPSFPADETGASPCQASTSPVKQRVWRLKTCPCLPCRRPGSSPAPASLTQPPPTPLNLALPSPAVRVRLAAKTSAAVHTPWRAALAGFRAPGSALSSLPMDRSVPCLWSPQPVPWASGKGSQAQGPPRECGAELKMTPRAQEGRSVLAIKASSALLPQKSRESSRHTLCSPSLCCLPG